MSDKKRVIVNIVDKETGINILTYRAENKTIKGIKAELKRRSFAVTDNMVCRIEFDLWK